jgi:hypothetical protein
MKGHLQALAVLALLGCAAAHAEDFGGSRPLLCATIEAADCASGADCVKGLPDRMGLPQFFRIDFAGKAIVGPERSSAVRLLEASDTQLLLQGTELGYGWTIALDRTDGKIAVTLANREGAFVVFGACTVE